MIHSILCVQFTCLTVLFDNLSPGPLWSSLVFLVLDPILHTRCISSPRHHLLFAAHAHTNAACSAAIPMLCHLYLVSLSAPNSTLSTTTFTRYNTAEANKDSNKTNRHQISGIPSLQFCWRPTIFARSTSAYFYWTEASQ